MSGDQPLVDMVDVVRRHGLGDVLTRTAARYPDRPALTWQDRTETYAELNATVNRMAHGLAERGVGKGDRIALLSHNCRDFVLVYFALAKLGAISVPINFMLNAEEVAFILGHSGARGYMAEDGLVPVMGDAIGLAGGAPAGAVHGWIPTGAADPAPGWEDVAAWSRHADDSEPGVPVADDDPVQLMYTSGTESRPKGVTLTSRSLITQYVSCVIDGDYDEDDVEVHSLPLYHCAQLHGFLTPDVYLGARSVILPGPDPELILRTIERERATKLFCPPTVWIALLRSPAFDRHDLSSLRKGYYGASPMPVEVLKEIGDRLPDVRLWNFYGQTEMAPVATVLKPHDQASHAGSAGRPCINVETRIVDDEDQPVAPGVVGEVVHRSPQALLGYWNDPDKTAEAFRNGWFHSGDLGVMDPDGYLTIVDRKKDMIKTGGENVASREVEEALFEHPAVAEAAVFGVPHPLWIEAVAAVVVLKDGEAVTEQDLIAHARQRLAGYKTPKRIVLADHLPKNPSGKILKRQLRSDYASIADAEPAGA
jgi:fatty-acyl-CoA synthase